MAGVKSSEKDRLGGLGVRSAGKRFVKEDLKMWVLCGQKNTDALPRRKDVGEWRQVGNGT